MLARYYSSSLGRFITVDPGDDTNPENPQSWNKYAYVRNNPLKTIDPKGTAGEPSQAQLDQMAAQATMQQLEPQFKAMEQAAQAAQFKKVGDAVCAVAPEVGDRAGKAILVLVAMTPETGAAGPAAVVTGSIALAGHGTAGMCQPSTERVTEVVVDVLGMASEATAAKIAMKAPEAAPLIKAGLPAVTGEIISEAARPVVKKATEAML